VEVGSELQQTYQPGERFVIQRRWTTPPSTTRSAIAMAGAGIHKVAVSYTLPATWQNISLIPEEVLAAGCLLSLPDPSLPHAHAAISEPISCARLGPGTSHAPGAKQRAG